MKPSAGADRTNLPASEGLPTPVQTAMLRAEPQAALMATEPRFREIWENAQDIIYTHDLRGNFTSLNRAVERITGHTRLEALSMNWRQLVVPEHHERTARLLERKLRGEQVSPFEVELVAKDGRRVPVEIKAHPIVDEGRVVGVQGIARDVSERRLAAAALQASEDKFRSLVEQSLIGIYIIVAGKFVYVNPRFCEIFGRSAQSIYAGSVGDLVADADRETVLENLRKRFVGEIKDLRYIFHGQRGDGTSVPVEVHGGRTTFNGRTAVIGSLLDITDRLRAEKALRESDRRFRDLLQNVDMVSLMMDPQGVVFDCNDYLLELTGLRREELLGRNWFDICVPADERAPRLARYQQRVHEDKVRSHFEHTIRTKSGELRLLAWSNIVLRDEEGRTLGVASLAVDITESRRAEAALRESEERYALAAEGAADGLWDWDMRTGRIFFSPRWKSMLGFGEAEIAGTLDEWTSLVHPDDRRRFRADLASHVEGRTPHLESEHRLRTRDGSHRWMLVRGIAVRDETGRAYRIAGSQTDITERKQSEVKLLHDAFHDGLTGLPNRALLVDRLGLALARQRRRGDSLFAVLFIDLDRFKVVNDSLGHLSGDQLLISVARRLEQCLRPGDTVARFGGDEFMVLLEELTSPEEAVQIAERVQTVLAAPVQLAGQQVFATASIGVALSRAGYSDAVELLRDADTAMYRAKEQGRARHAVFDPGMHARAVERLRVEHALRPALERREFILEFQPVVKLSDGKLVGSEALIRWQHPTRGLVPPSEFVPVAEETGLILPMGEWALSEACRQTRAWQERFPFLHDLTVSVNLSARQFLQMDLATRVRAALDAAGLSPQRLHLEITESVIMENSSQAASLIRQLKDLGVHVHLDDFGTGYSSLAYLHQFQVDALKIDRTFVSRMKSADGARLVRAIVNLARDLDVAVIAEGTETAAQVKQLCGLRCDFAQGYYFAPPLRAELFEALVEGKRPPGPHRKS